MAIIKPFKALRPKKELAEQVASRPYDVLNSVKKQKKKQQVITIHFFACYKIRN